MMMPTQRISMTLIKFRENIFQIISQGLLKTTLKSINFPHENMQRHTESIKFWLFFVKVNFSGILHLSERMFWIYTGSIKYNN